MSPTRQEIQAALRKRASAGKRGRVPRETELLLLLAVSIAVSAGFTLVYQAKARNFQQIRESVAKGTLVNLNAIRASPLEGILTDIQDANSRRFVAARIAGAARRARLPNVGALRKIDVSLADVEGKDLPALAQKVQQGITQNGRDHTPVLTPAELRSIKPLLIVRTPAEFRNEFLLWAGIFFVCFFGLHLFWGIRGFEGDQLILPAIELLCGIGMMMMVSLRDPLRDVLILSDFGTGITIGAIAMAGFSLINYERTSRRFTWAFFLLAAVLAGLLMAVGTGPGGSQVKVNLGFFQPVEVMRILIAFFLAGYFADNWEMLRHLKERRSRLAQWLHVPRIDYALPVAIGVLLSLVLFYLLKDNGPALVIGAAFMMIYACARRRPSGAIAGFLVIIAVFWLAHHFRFSPTVADRIDMWRSPWANTVAGGTQVAHAMWSLATGGVFGSGPGLGSPAVIPAGHTDLILSAAGEELGLVGLVCILALYGILVWRGFRTALSAPGTYSFFLVLGLSLIVVLQLILIAGGEFGVIPLSGVVSPFLSFGKTSMVANFIAFAAILSVSSRMRTGAQVGNFKVPVRWLTGALAVAGLVILGNVVWIQAVKADEILVRGAVERIQVTDNVSGDSGDGQKTTRTAYGLAYNPRINEVIRLVGRGDIVDRNGVPLATSNWSTVEQHRADYKRLGVDLEKTSSRGEPRHYPLGPEFFYLTGDVSAYLQSSAFIERGSRRRLEGFDDRRLRTGLEAGENGELLQYEGAELSAVLKEREDLKDDKKDDKTPPPNVVNEYDYSDLIPIVRHRNEPGSSELREFLAQDRSVRMSIDAGFQLKASAILKKHIEATGNRKGALVVLDTATGDLLAAVSYPWPELEQYERFKKTANPQILAAFVDRARAGFYTPGSSFKIVTAVAALNSDPALDHKVYKCVSLGGGRVGNYVGNSRRPIRDDVGDTVPHGVVTLGEGIRVSCNAYFAQLGAGLGSDTLFKTASQFGILVASPNTSARLNSFLPQASYGQGEVRVTPFQMARVAATIGNGGIMPEGRWIIDDSNPRTQPPAPILDPQLAGKIAAYMREVVVSGTGKVLQNSPIPIAGKTGTAEVKNARSHAWFIGFAPAGQQTGGKRIAFAVLVENGSYGGTVAAPIAGELVEAAREAGLI